MLVTDTSFTDFIVTTCRIRACVNKLTAIVGDTKMMVGLLRQTRERGYKRRERKRRKEERKKRKKRKKRKQ